MYIYIYIYKKRDMQEKRQGWKKNNLHLIGREKKQKIRGELKY
jgi:hypothetical protein